MKQKKQEDDARKGKPKKLGILTTDDKESEATKGILTEKVKSSRKLVALRAQPWLHYCGGESGL